ncbi:hypothetical protein D3C83_143890 [compost metagenome]
MVSSSPPTSVQARPVTWPTWFCFSAMPKLYLRTPRNLSRFFGDTVMRRALPSAACRSVSSCLTALRQILEISRSRLRTPASRV